MNLKPNDHFTDKSRGKKYQVHSQIGVGSYGVVYLVEEMLYKQKFALKVQNQITEQEHKLLELFVKRKFSNLVNTISYGQHQNRYPYSIMEYCQENLYETITSKGTITNEQFRYVAHQIATGLKELHELGLIHRDIKPENIMQFDHVDQQTKKVQKTYKICDFGLVMQQNSAKTQFSGTPYYLAPEQLNNQATNYSNKVDIWALGTVFYELVTGQPLFQARIQEQIYDQIRNKQIDEIIQKLSLKHEYQLLIKRMLNRDPDKRPAIQEVVIQLSSKISMKPTQVPKSGIVQPQPNQSRIQQQQLDLINSFKKKKVENQSELIGKQVNQADNNHQIQQIPIEKKLQIFNQIAVEGGQQQNQQVQPRRELNNQNPTQNQKNIGRFFSPQLRTGEQNQIQIQKIKIIKPMNNNQNDLANPSKLNNQGSTLVPQQMSNHQQQAEPNQLMNQQDQEHKLKKIELIQQDSSQPIQLKNQQENQTQFQKDRVSRQLMQDESNKQKWIFFSLQPIKPHIPNHQIQKDVTNLLHPSIFNNQAQAIVPHHKLQNQFQQDESDRAIYQSPQLNKQMQRPIQSISVKPQTSEYISTLDNQKKVSTICPQQKNCVYKMPFQSEIQNSNVNQGQINYYQHRIPTQNHPQPIEASMNLNKVSIFETNLNSSSHNLELQQLDLINSQKKEKVENQSELIGILVNQADNNQQIQQNPIEKNLQIFNQIAVEDEQQQNQQIPPRRELNNSNPTQNQKYIRRYFSPQLRIGENHSIQPHFNGNQTKQENITTTQQRVQHIQLIDEPIQSQEKQIYSQPSVLELIQQDQVIPSQINLQPIQKQGQNISTNNKIKIFEINQPP